VVENIRDIKGNENDIETQTHGPENIRSLLFDRDVGHCVSHEQEQLKVVHDVEDRIESDDEVIARIVHLDEGEHQVRSEMEGIENDESEETKLIFPFVFLEKNVDGMNQEKGYADDAYRCVECAFAVHFQYCTKFVQVIKQRPSKEKGPYGARGPYDTGLIAEWLERV
jgi:hypothetical protein